MGIFTFIISFILTFIISFILPSLFPSFLEKALVFNKCKVNMKGNNEGNNEGNNGYFYLGVFTLELSDRNVQADTANIKQEELCETNYIEFTIIE